MSVDFFDMTSGKFSIDEPTNGVSKREHVGSRNPLFERTST